MTMMLDRVLSFVSDVLFNLYLSDIFFLCYGGSRGTADIGALSYAATTPTKTLNMKYKIT